MVALFTIDARAEGLEAVDKALSRLDPLASAELLEGIARMVQEQTRRRITNEKRAPSGAAWPPNRTGTPILYRSGALTRSIDYAISGDAAIVGSGLVYAGIHQRGGTITPKKAKRLVFRMGNKTIFARKVTIPARPYLGLSAENAEDVIDQVGRFLAKKLGGG
ncbi:MAG TPA: phage virion morphogenesis protein [Rhabdaerophilum sp.]|nr:phage virion morphogenesis protein [Rhabdaerophilum sp.]